jgi:hypothetical protein
MPARAPGRPACLALLPLALAAGPAAADDAEAQKPVGRQMLDGLLSSFSLPLGDLLQKKHDSEWRNLLDGLGVATGLTYPLQHRNLGNLTRGGRLQGSQGQQAPLSPTLDLSLRYTPVSYWFVGTTLYKYLGAQQPWEPDFSYSFGYDDYHPYTLSLVYSNYNGNRFNPRRGESALNFEEGTWALGWKFPLPQVVAEPLLIDPSAQINCQVGYEVSPHFFDLGHNTNKYWKEAYTFGCNYPIYKGLFLNWTAFYHPDPSDQQPWDPDFTYVLGYSGTEYGNFSIQYSNYSGNRYPWREATQGNGQLTSGAVGVSWSWSW